MQPEGINLCYSKIRLFELTEILSRTQLLLEDNNIFDEMEEDGELFHQAGVPTHTILKDKAISQHGILKATIKQTISTLPILLMGQTSILKLL